MALKTREEINIHPLSFYLTSLQESRESTMGVQKLQVGMAGLGRVGKIHAINFLQRTPRAQLVAAFTPDPNGVSWGKLNLEPHGVTLYDNYDEMLKHPGLQAVAIGTATSVHAEEAIKAIERDLHVLCEKPLSIDVEVV